MSKKEEKSRFELALDAFNERCEEFFQNIRSRSKKSQISGTIDPCTILLLEACKQLNNDAKRYYTADPNNILSALVWLQKAFFVCRSFQSETLIENKDRVKHYVGDKLVPWDSNKKWGDVTSPSTMIRDNLNYGTLPFNHEVNELVRKEIDKGKFVHALTLVCDAPKHGVMSPLLNLIISMKKAEEIYILGFGAATLSIEAFIDHINKEAV